MVLGGKSHAVPRPMAPGRPGSHTTRRTPRPWPHDGGQDLGRGASRTIRLDEPAGLRTRGHPASQSLGRGTARSSEWPDDVGPDTGGVLGDVEEHPLARNQRAVRVATDSRTVGDGLQTATVLDDDAYPLPPRLLASSPPGGSRRVDEAITMMSALTYARVEHRRRGQAVTSSGRGPDRALRPVRRGAARSASSLPRARRTPRARAGRCGPGAGECRPTWAPE
jgi:hypothetical protein